MKNLSSRLIILLVAIRLNPSPASSTQQHNVISKSACDECTLTLEHIARIGDPSGDGIMGEILYITQGAGGRWYAGSHFERDRIKMFSSDGRYLESIGREGKGPGEFSGIYKVVADAFDTLHVFDRGNQRYTVLDPARAVVRSRPLGLHPSNAIVLRNGATVYSGSRPSSDAFGMALHVMLNDSLSTHSFAEDPSVVTVRDTYSRLIRNLAPGRSPGTFWEASYQAYEIRLWSIAGELIRRIERRADWFEPYTGLWGVPDPEGDNPPKPFIVDVTEDMHGLLWVFIVVADPKWQEGIRVENDASHGTAIYAHSYAKLYDGIIEVLDPLGGRVVASSRFDGPVRNVGNGIVFQIVEGSNGEFYYDLYRARLTQ